MQTGIIIALVACVAAVAGYFLNRDKKIIKDSEWKGSVTTKLDTIQCTIVQLAMDIKNMQQVLNSQNDRIHILEEKVQNIENRLKNIRT